MQSEQVGDVVNVVQFIGIGNVAAVPCGEDVAGMPCGERKMPGIANKAGGHELVGDVEFDGLVYFRRIVERRQVSGRRVASFCKGRS